MAMSKQVIFGAVAFAFLIAITAVGLNDPKEFEGSRFGIFIKVLSSLAFILVALGLILTAQAFEEGQKLNKIAETFRLIDRSLMDQVKRMRELYPRCPRFVESLWPQTGIFTGKI
jgi:NADH:ubiquinone oxidoreductase subunit 6 (subunit J)